MRYCENIFIESLKRIEHPMSTNTPSAPSSPPVVSLTAGSHLHIQKIQQLTGGDVFVSQWKITKLRNFQIYSRALKIRGYKFEYYVNAIFSPELLDKARRRDDPDKPVEIENQKRDKKRSVNAGKRHDLTLDFEIQKQNAAGEWVKGRAATNDEKAELLNVLEKLSCIAWAGRTPNGIHAGIYFAEWVESEDARLVVDWVWDEIRANGYTGPLQLDEGASKNCNRPSRFLDLFAFWRPEKSMGSAEVQTIKKAVSVMPQVKPARGKKGRQGGSMYGLSKIVSALRLRAYNVREAKIAATLGESLAWVEKLFNDLPQEAFNTFCKDLGREVGPRSSGGKYLSLTEFRHNRTLLYINCLLSWKSLWDRGVDVAKAKQLVFTDPAFNPIMIEIEKAFIEALVLNGAPHKKYATWQDWTERDIERCYEKYARETDAVLAAVEKAVLKCGQPTFQISQILPKVTYGKTTVRKALKDLGFKLVKRGRTSFWDAPLWFFFKPADLSDLPDVTDSSKNIEIYSKVAPEILDALSWEQGDAPAKPRKPRKKKLKPMDTLLEIGQMEIQTPPIRPEITETQIRQRLKGDRRFTQLISTLDKEYANSKKFKNPFDDEVPPRDLLLELVRGWLAENGDVYHSSSHLYDLLIAIFGNEGLLQSLHWLLASRHVLSCNAWVPDKGDWVGWTDYVRGELRFAWRIIEQGAGGGSVEVISGAPGTGKTETLADELKAARNKKLVTRVGSATHLSAQQLRERLGKGVAVETIHATYHIRPRKQKKRFVALRADVFAGDEIGQVDCDVAGQMAMSWAHGKRVLLTVGPGQNMPVGPGLVGEDLVRWVQRNPGTPGVTGTPLSHNWRTSNLLASGIVDFFEQVHLGQVPEKIGPGMEVHYLKSEFQVMQAAAGFVAALPPESNFMVFCPRHADVFKVNSNILQMTRAAAGHHKDTIFDFKKGDALTVVEVGAKAAAYKIRKGSIVTVYESTATTGQPSDNIQVTYTAADGSKNVGWLTLDEVDWPWCRTGHSSQGVECDTGIVVMTDSLVTNRRWLYTAVSRCRKKCILLCERDTLEKCIHPDNNPERRTMLPVFLDKAREHFH